MSTFGTRYRTLEEVVSILERGLGLSFDKHDDSETGIDYSWADPPDANGFSWHAIYVQPTRVLNTEENKIELRLPEWAPYTIVIDMSDELQEFHARIRDMIARGALKAVEIPEKPS